jgi:hypothetical protein
MRDCSDCTLGTMDLETSPVFLSAVGVFWFQFAPIKAVNREDKRSRRYRDRHFAKFERSRRYRDR